MSTQAEQSGRLNDCSAAQIAGRFSPQPPNASQDRAARPVPGRDGFQLNPVTSGGPVGLQPRNFDPFPLWYVSGPRGPPCDGANQSKTGLCWSNGLFKATGPRYVSFRNKVLLCQVLSIRATETRTLCASGARLMCTLGVRLGVVPLVY